MNNLSIKLSNTGIKKRSQSHALLLISTIGILLSAILLVACPADSTSDTDKPIPVQITVNEIPKKTPTDVRDSYILFTISSAKRLYDYHLAVKEKGESTPTVQEMTDNALKRIVSPEPINILIAQRMGAPMIDVAKDYFANGQNADKTLGIDMKSDWHDDYKLAVIYDDKAVGEHRWVENSVLKPDTEYVLYGMQEAIMVENLGEFSTDPTLMSNVGSQTVLYLADTTLEDISIDVYGDEFYILPTQVWVDNTADMHFCNLYYSGRSGGNIQIEFATREIYIIADSGFKSIIHMFREMKNDNLTHGLGTYQLIHTKETKFDNNSAVFGLSMTDSVGYETILRKNFKIANNVTSLVYFSNLSLTIDGKDYPVSFNGTSVTVDIESKTIPSTATVKSIEEMGGSSTLKEGDVITITVGDDPKTGVATLAITTEEGYVYNFYINLRASD